MDKYIKKPIPIEAVQFQLLIQPCEPEQCFLDFKIQKDDKGYFLTIPTPEGNHRADVGDWIAKGYSSKQGYHYWPIKPDYFEENYSKFSSPKSEESDCDKWLKERHPEYCKCGIKIEKQGSGINGIDVCEKCFHEATKHVKFGSPKSEINRELVEELKNVDNYLGAYCELGRMDNCSHCAMKMSIHKALSRASKEEGK